MENSDITAFENTLTSIDVRNLYGNNLNDFLQNMLAYINDLAEKSRCLEEGYEGANEILEKLNKLHTIFLKISMPQIEESGVISLYNEAHFTMKYYIAHVYYLTVIHDTFYVNKPLKPNRQYYINFNTSYDFLIKYLQSEILQNLSKITLEPNIKNIINFNSHYIICNMILNLNSIKQTRKLNLHKDEIANLFSHFVCLTNIALDDAVTRGHIEKLLPRFFEVVNDNVWNENIEKYNEETLKNLKQIRYAWLKKESEERSFRKAGVEDLNELVREIEGDTKPHQRDLDKDKKPKQPKGKKSKGKRPKKKTSAKERNNSQNTQSIQTTDGTDKFLAALSISLKQLKEHQNKNSGQAHVNLSKNSESTETENRNLPPSDFVEKVEKFLQKRWGKAENDLNAVKLGELPSQSFTNK